MRKPGERKVTADYNDMIYAASAAEIEKKRKAFLRKWRLRCQAVADCLEEAGDRLLTFTKLPASQWKSARTTNAIERLHEEFKRRIKTQTVLASAGNRGHDVLGAGRLRDAKTASALPCHCDACMMNEEFSFHSLITQGANHAQ